MTTRRLILDIETAAIPDTLLSMIIPEFDPIQVKCGNLKDEVKIAAKIAEAKTTHFEDYKATAALSAMTGQIVAVGALTNAGCSINAGIEEQRMIEIVWATIVEKVQHEGFILTGWNITGFDLPFLMKRSFRYKIRPPGWLRDGRYWHRSVVDLLDVWRMGEYTRDEGKRVGYSLNNVAKFLGLGAKTGSGADFAELLKTDRPAAEAYLRRDLELTAAISDLIL